MLIPKDEARSPTNLMTHIATALPIWIYVRSLRKRTQRNGRYQFPIQASFASARRSMSNCLDKSATLVVDAMSKLPHTSLMVSVRCRYENRCIACLRHWHSGKIAGLCVTKARCHTDGRKAAQASPIFGTVGNQSKR